MSVAYISRFVMYKNTFIQILWWSGSGFTGMVAVSARD